MTEATGRLVADTRGIILMYKRLILVVGMGAAGIPFPAAALGAMLMLTYGRPRCDFGGDLLFSDSIYCRDGRMTYKQFASPAMVPT
jgi:hypothetical protein